MIDKIIPNFPKDKREKAKQVLHQLLAESKVTLIVSIKVLLILKVLEWAKIKHHMRVRGPNKFILPGCTLRHISDSILSSQNISLLTTVLTEKLTKNKKVFGSTIDKILEVGVQVPQIFQSLK